MLLRFISFREGGQGMLYCMSDIHGEYEKYRKMLETIRFSDADTLYILGDMIDRGPAPVEVLQDVAARANVYPILGNHELMAREALKHLLVDVTEENAETHLRAEDLAALQEWLQNGGETTLRGFRKLGKAARADLLDFLCDLPLYETVETGENAFVLVHAGLGNFQAGKPLPAYSAFDLVWAETNLSKRYFDDVSTFLIVGHTPTMVLAGAPKIYRCQNNFCIDCGAVFGGRLSCLRLDDFAEFYVE